MAGGRRGGGITYSTELGRMCPGCERPVAACSCRKKEAAPTSSTDGVVRVSRETKGRKGKGVTLIAGVPVSESELVELAKSLKRSCGSGGTIKGGIIEIQGDHRDKLVGALESMGYRVKRVGG